jgi:anti-sigma B factor antagonist
MVESTALRRPYLNLQVDRAESPSGPVVISATGELDVYTAPRLRAALDSEPATAGLVVDLSGLDFIDSTGLGVIVATHQRLSDAGGQLVLAVGSDRVERPFKLAGLLGVLNVHPDLAAALGAVEG